MIAITSQGGRKPILGLRSEGVDDEFDQLFSEDSEDETPIPMLRTGSLLSFARTVTPLSLHSIVKMNEVKKFEDIGKQISTLTAALEEYTVPMPFSGQFDLIPERIAPHELNNAIMKFIRTKNFEEFEAFLSNFDDSDLPESHFVQLQLAIHAGRKSKNLMSLNEIQVDPRVSSLLQFEIAKTFDSAPSKALAYYLNSAIDFVKSNSMAPIALLFPDFTINNILTKLCEELNKVFPKHPIVPSAIHKLSAFISDPESVLKLISDPESGDLESDLFSSDSSFSALADLRNGSSEAPMLSLAPAENVPVDILDLSTIPQPIEIVTFPDTPSTATYLLKNGTDKMQQVEFIDWLSNPVNQASDAPPVIIAVNDRRIQDKASSLPSVHTKMLTKQKREVNFTTLYQEMMDGGDIHVDDDPTIDPSQYALMLPIIHWININPDKPCTNSLMAPRILTAEYKAHRSITKRDQKLFQDALELLYVHIPENLPTAPIESLSSKRPLPPLIGAFNNDVVAMMALIDCHLMLEGRSPLTLMMSNWSVCPPEINHNVMNREWRIQALYALYTSIMFPPYLSFRAAFAIGISVIDSSPVFATRILFEGLYVLLTPFPVFRKSLWCNMGFFAFGEALNAAGKYSYCAIAHDNAISLSSMDARLSNKAGQIAQKNKDHLRAVYHYLQALQIYLKDQSQSDGALFTAQVVASIYLENYLYIEGIKLLNSIMMNTYHFSVRIARSRADRHGSLKLKNRKDVTVSDMAPLEAFPKPDGINSILTAAAQCQFLIKMNQFSSAIKLLNKVQSSAGSESISRVLSFLRIKIAYASGDFAAIHTHTKSADLFLAPGRPRSGSTKLFKFSILTFNTKLASLKVLAKAGLEREMGPSALFWSEMICHNTSKYTMIQGNSGIGFHLRAQALYAMYRVAHTHEDEFPVAYELGQLESSIGQFNPRESVTKHVLLQEALSSFNYARICFETVGNMSKLLESSVQYLELLIHHFVFAKLLLRGDAESIVLQKPHLYTHLNGAGKTEVSETEIVTINWSNLTKHIAPILQGVRQLSKTLMNPIFVIRSQILDGFENVLKNSVEAAKKCFSMALNNFRNYFFIDTSFVMREMSIRHLLQIRNGLQSLQILLFTFEPDFMRRNVIVFDLVNEVKALVKNRMRVKGYEPHLRFAENSKRHPHLVELANMAYPDFLPILRSKNYIGKHKPKSMLDRKWQLIILFGKIRSACRQLAQGKLPEQKVTERNASCCREIEALMKAEAKSRGKNSVLPCDLPKHVITPYLFVSRIHDCICTFIPLTGSKRYLKLAHDTGEMWNWQLHGKNVKLLLSSSVFSKSFLRIMIQLIAAEPHKETSTGVKSQFTKFCASLAELLFGQGAVDRILEEYSYTPVPDNIPVGRTKIFGHSSNGCLSTVTVGKTPITVVADCDTQFIPYEMMFKHVVVIRSSGFYSSYMRCMRAKIPFDVTVFRWKSDEEHIHKACYHRSLENAQCLLLHAGSDISPSLYVSDRERIGPMPLTIFHQKKDCQYYTKKYPFANVVQIVPELIPEVENYIDSIFVMSYADLVEWPELLSRLVKENMRSSFLFVPSSHMKSAMKVIRGIFARHAKRATYVQNHERDKDTTTILATLMESPLQFVGTIQATLMNALNVPIGMIVYSKDA